MEDQRIPEKTLREIVCVLFRHKKPAIYCFSFFLLASLLVTFFWIKSYRSEAKVLVKLGRENVSLDPTATMGEYVNIDMDRDSEVNSELEILNSREISEKVVDTIGPDTIKYGYTNEDSPVNTFSYRIRKIVLFPVSMVLGCVDFIKNIGVPENIRKERKRDSVVQGLMKDLEIKAVKRSSIITLSYDSKDPQVAHDVLANLIRFYLDKHVEVHRTLGSQKFFDQQKEDLGNELVTIEEKIRNYKNETGFSSLQDQMKILLQIIGELQREIQMTESELAASDAKIESLEAALNDLPVELITEKTSGIPLSSKEELRKRLNELKLSEQQLLATFNEQSPPIEEIRRQIDEAEELLQKEEDKNQVTRGINVSHQQLELALMTEDGINAALRAKAEKLKKQLAQEEEKLKVLNETEVVMSDLERRKKISEKSFIKYSESLEESRIDDELKKDKISNISIVQPATLPVRHLLPKGVLNIVLGIMIGITGAIGLAFFREYLDHTFVKPEDIKKKLKLPVFAALPLFHDNDALKPDIISIKNLIKIPEPLDEAFGMTSEKKDYNNEVQQYFEYLLHSILFTYKDNTLSTARIFGVVSCQPGEGATTVANNLAANLTRVAQGPVLLIDMKQLKSKEKKVFETPYPNLGNILALRQGPSNSKTNSRLPDRIDTLYLMHSSTQANPVELNDLMSVWKKEYEFVVIDLPPMQNDPSVMALAHLAEEIIWVVEAERVTAETALAQKERMMQSGISVTGVVLNKRRYYIPQKLYTWLS